jgi:two-component system sensor histidine kinase KdpD
MLYLLAVALAAYRWPWPWSAAFAIAAVTALNFFFVPPRYTLEVENHEYLIALVAMLAVALSISQLASAALCPRLYCSTSAPNTSEIDSLSAPDCPR